MTGGDVVRVERGSLGERSEIFAALEDLPDEPLDRVVRGRSPQRRIETALQRLAGLRPLPRILRRLVGAVRLARRDDEETLGQRPFFETRDVENFEAGCEAREARA